MNAQQRMQVEAKLEALNKGEQLRLSIDDGHDVLVMLTNEEGIHSGRPRFLVVCVTCEVLLHEATTGPIERMNVHAEGLFKPRS